MKRFSPRQTIYLGLPLLLAGAAAVSVTNAREKVRVFYSHPFAPQLKLVRARVPHVPGLFEAEARCVALGGRGQSRWLLRGQLFDLSGKIPQRIWSTDNRLSPQRVTFINSGGAGVSVGAPLSPLPSAEAGFYWRFSRDGKTVPHAKFVLEAVALPNPGQGAPAGTLTTRINMNGQGISVSEATQSDITAAKYLPGAQYFSTSLVLDARDDAKYFYALGQ